MKMLEALGGVGSDDGKRIFVKQIREIHKERKNHEVRKGGYPELFQDHVRKFRC